MNPAFDSLKKKPGVLNAPEEDLPPGVSGSYYGGPLANLPKPTPPPTPPDDKKRRP